MRLTGACLGDICGLLVVLLEYTSLSSHGRILDSLPNLFNVKAVAVADATGPPVFDLADWEIDMRGFEDLRFPFNAW
jgi:hypothetical protein